MLAVAERCPSSWEGAAWQGIARAMSREGRYRNGRGNRRCFKKDTGGASIEVTAPTQGWALPSVRALSGCAPAE